MLTYEEVRWIVVFVSIGMLAAGTALGTGIGIWYREKKHDELREDKDG